ncbi:MULTISPECIES: cupin domain-containing protein [unclassified Rhizobium]|uniref:cupin domain-containing protein n=1 Tax=unclassified Rhizobium TaxID=2613769 RepID=UPI001ADC7C9C|nr:MULTISPECIES: cupin domain-containing protein [unclassified Rhizobium]MBO9098028.1 cupin domain-containing protein [Rhizobium sp. L58/93]MBO9133189.1 cupin domain-containing protein [Rhizobium sp. B209b/85]MBO9168179.1 cupin domain-containing protein [Rhizobium sp. L245/93]MBO9184224.1 cupin domain-containing protein [Rhizobium sp. E27B/91]QXZ84428.1 cupin domain-containing protein [Rhizobium sp. K1/93]
MTDTDKVAVSLDALPLEDWQQGEYYGGSDASFGAIIGLKQLGMSYNIVPPGKSGCPFHNHHVEDEAFIILSGQGDYRFGARRITVKAGDVLGAPAGGPETAHQLINTGDVPLVFIAVSTMARTEICEYPDSGKFMAKTRAGDAITKSFRFVGREESHVDYWDGDPGA